MTIVRFHKVTILIYNCIVFPLKQSFIVTLEVLLRYKLYVEHQNARYKFYEMLGIEENATHEIISLAVTDLKMKIISKS